MTTKETGPWLWVTAAVAGIAIGAVSVYPYEYTSGPAHILGNSAALWLLFAFGFGAAARRVGRGAIVGTVLLVTIVVAFFTVLDWLYHGDFGRAELFWLGTALVGGPIFGAFGALWRTGKPVAQGIAAAAVGSAFVAEAAAFQGSAGLGIVVAEMAFGVALTAVLAHGRRQRIAAACALPVVIAAGLGGWFLTHHLLHLTFN